MRHPDEGTIHAWLDQALPPDESEAIEAHVASCSRCAEAVAEARGLIAAASRVLTALDDVPGGVLPVAGERASGTSDDLAALRLRKAADDVMRRRRWWKKGWVSVAAAVVFVAAGTVAVVQRSDHSTTQLVDSIAASSVPQPTASAPASPLPATDSLSVARAAPARTAGKKTVPQPMAANAPLGGASNTSPRSEALKDVGRQQIAAQDAPRAAGALDERKRAALASGAPHEAAPATSTANAVEPKSDVKVEAARGGAAPAERSVRAFAPAPAALEAKAQPRDSFAAKPAAAAETRLAVTGGRPALGLTCYQLRADDAGRFGVPVRFMLDTVAVPATGAGWFALQSLDQAYAGTSFVWTAEPRGGGTMHIAIRRAGAPGNAVVVATTPRNADVAAAIPTRPDVRRFAPADAVIAATETACRR